MDGDVNEINANPLYGNMADQLDFIFDIIEKQIKEQAKKEIKLIKEKALQESEEKLYDLQLQSQHNFSSLELLFGNNGDKWAKELFESIVQPN